MKTGGIGRIALAATALAGLGGAAAAGHERLPAEEHLSALIHARLRAGGPLFTPAERAVIEAKCGYAPGSWDGFQATMADGVFHCTNGRRVDDPQMRALMQAARPRIQRRVGAVMESAEVRASIARISSEATARAMAELATREGRRGR